MSFIQLLTIFIITLFISFIGSIQLGPVNVSVINAAVLKKYKSALYIGFGGALPELFYSTLAIQSLSFINQYHFIQEYLSYICIPLFFILGIYFLFKKPEININIDLEVHNNKSKISNLKSMFLGFSLGLFNPLLLPFWLMVINMYDQNQLILIHTILGKLAFVLGTAVGAFLLQYCIVKCIRMYEEKFDKYFKGYAYKITGWSFILIAIIQLYNSAANLNVLQ